MTETVSRLTDAEREFLRGLFADSALSALASEEQRLALESPSVEPALLLRLLGQMHSELVATDGCYCLRFRLEVVADPLGGQPALRLAPPTVVDRQGVERSARVRPLRGEVGLLDPIGRLEGARILDISPSGMALDPGGRRLPEPGSRLANLQLRLPGQAPFRVSGQVVRVEANPYRLALRFEDVPVAGQAALSYYVFDRYGR